MLKPDCFIYLLLYVDDMLIASADMEAIKELKNLLQSEFEMKDLGAARRILGMDIINGKRGIRTLGTKICTTD